MLAPKLWIIAPCALSEKVEKMSHIQIPLISVSGSFKWKRFVPVSECKDMSNKISVQIKFQKFAKIVQIVLSGRSNGSFKPFTSFISFVRFVRSTRSVWSFGRFILVRVVYL